MKHISFVVVLLIVGLLVGCAPAMSQDGSDVARGENELASEPTSSGPVNISVPPSKLTPTNPLTVAPTGIPTPLATLTPTDAPAPTDTAVPSDTLTPPSTATAEPASPTDNAISEEVTAYGLQIYQQNYCGLCHQLDAAGTAGAFGPTHNHMAATAEQRIHETGYTGAAKTAAEYIRESILQPEVYLAKGYESSPYHMPALTNLTEADLNALVSLLLQQK